MSDISPYAKLIDAAWEELRVQFDLNETSLRTATNTALYSNAYPNMRALHGQVLGDEKLSRLRSGWLEHSGHGSTVYADGIVHYLMRTRQHGRPIDQALQEVWGFAAAGESAYARIIALGGVTVPKRLSLADDLELVPWENVDDAPRKLGLEKMLAPDNQPFPVKPTAALIYRLPIRRVLFDAPPDPSDQSGAVRRMQEAQKNDDYVRSAVAFLPLFTLSRVHVHGAFTTLSNPVADTVWSTGPSYTLERALVPSIIIEDESIGSLFRQYLKFPHQPGLALTVAIRKLAEAAGRQSIVDKAIDIGTILEMLLLHELNERGELTYRIRVRGATFLEEGASRVEVYRKLGKIYALRSTAAHKGQVAHNEKTIATLADGMAICAGLIKKLIGLGRFPDWEREFVLAAAGEPATTPGRESNPLD